MTNTCLDSSNYHPDHFMYTNDHRAELGYFKDEAAGELIVEMILLKPKMYSIHTLKGSKETRRAKGIKRSLVKTFTHEQYKKVYESTGETLCVYKNLVSKNHVVKTKTITKAGLSYWEDKRAWLKKNYSLPYGHYKLKNLDSIEQPSKHKKLSA